MASREPRALEAAGGTELGEAGCEASQRRELIRDNGTNGDEEEAPPVRILLLAFLIMFQGHLVEEML